MTSAQKGFTLIELILVLTIFALAAFITVPPLLQASSRMRMRMAAREVSGVLHKSRMAAVRHSANVAVKFRTAPNGRVTFTLYRDDNGNGVRNRDIDRGVDPAVSKPQELQMLGRGIGFGFPRLKTPPRHPGNPRQRLDRLEDPIRFNRSDLASFTSQGTATPGSLYLTDGRDGLAAVRVTQYTGKIEVVIYDARRQKWSRE
jgi:prepilin-type N-terminal cleavage/methylation domain-containing protein